MKKSTKVILIIAAVLVGVGIIFAFIGGITGGARQFAYMAADGEFNYGSDDWGITVDSDNFNIGTYDNDFNDDFDNKDDFDDDSDNEVHDGDDDFDEDHDEDHDADTSGYSKVNAGDEKVMIASVDDGIKNLDIAIGAGEFFFEESEDGNFYVQDSENCRLYVRKSGDALSIRTKSRHSIIFFHIGSDSDGRATIYLPKETYDQVAISLGAGTLTGNTLSADKLSVSVGAGTMEMDSLQADTLSMEVGAGTCEVSRITANKAGVELAMGKLDAGMQVDSKLELEVGMGNADLTMEGSEKDFNYDIDCGAGSVNIGRGGYSGLATDQLVDNDAAKSMEIDCGMGNVDIAFED